MRLCDLADLNCDLTNLNCELVILICDPEWLLIETLPLASLSPCHIVSPSPPPPGHFGCIGIRERARKIGAEVKWESATGKGTTVCVELPLEK